VLGPPRACCGALPAALTHERVEVCAIEKRARWETPDATVVKPTRGDDQRAPGHRARAAPRRDPVWREVMSGMLQAIRQPGPARVIAVRVGDQTTRQRTVR